MTKLTSQKLTPKQERFAQCVAMGMTYSAAYRDAYDAENMKTESVNVSASKLMANPKVTLRVMELQEAARERTLVTIESLTAELEASRQLALQSKQAGAAVSATMGKAKIHGLIVNKAEVNRKRDISELDDAEIDALIASAE